MVWLVICPHGAPDIDATQCCIPQMLIAVHTCCFGIASLLENFGNWYFQYLVFTSVTFVTVSFLKYYL